MNDWAEGYVTEIGYTYGYYPELNPQRLRLPFLYAGLSFPSVGTACELGFGQGVSVNIHAAASVGSWYGTDFNPAQAGNAQSLAASWGGNQNFSDESFEEFCGRLDLPDFDYISLHGIWSWISEKNRAVIIDFIRRKLKVGGVVYVSYNALPGWVGFAPIRHLMLRHMESATGAGQSIGSRIKESLQFLDQFMAGNPGYARNNKYLLDQVSKLKEKDPSYIAHEYLNRDWLPVYFDHMAADMNDAKLTYACSAHYIDNIDRLVLSEGQRELVGKQQDPVLRETMRDFITNQQFRRDYWVKGRRQLSALERSQAFRAERVILACNQGDVSLKAGSPLGEITLGLETCEPILDLLSAHKPMSVGEIERALAPKGVLLANIVEVVMVLVGNGTLLSVQSDGDIVQAKKQTDKLNRNLMQRAHVNADINFLASPVTGGGVSIGRLEHLFLQAYAMGRKLPVEWARYAWDTLSPQGVYLLKEGRQLEGEQENMDELLKKALVFASKRLAVAKALKLI